MSNFNPDPNNQFGQQPSQPQGPGMQQPGLQGDQQQGPGMQQQGPGMQQPGFQGNLPPKKPEVDEGMENQKNMAALAHLLGPAIHWVMCGIGILVAIPPMIIWILNRGKGLDFLEDQAKETLNFQICICAIQLVLIPILAFGFWLIGWWIFLLNFLGLAVPNIALGGMAAAAAKQGITHRYPFNFRIIK